MQKSKIKLVLGSVVISKKGRDAGLCFAVVGMSNQNTVLVADGYTHKLISPKRKNIKHVSVLEPVLTNIAEKLATNKKVFDSELRSALKTYQQTLANKVNEE